MSNINQRMSDLEDGIMAERASISSLAFYHGGMTAGKHTAARYRSGRRSSTATVVMEVFPHQNEGVVEVLLNNKPVFKKKIAASSIMSDKTLLFCMKNKTTRDNLLEITLDGLSTDGMQILISGEALKSLPL